jgi:AcrR family transcriptional regulator
LFSKNKKDAMPETTRERRRKRNKNAILDTAAELIQSNGIENISVREIAKHADYSPAGLYKYFDSKAAIIQSVQARENQKLIELLQTVSGELSPTQRLVELSLLYIQYCLDNSVYLVLINSLPSGRKTKEQPVPTTSPYMLFLKAVDAWGQHEEINFQPDYGLEEITYTLWSLIHGMAALRVSQLKDFEADFQSVNKHSIELFLSGLQQL